MFVVITIRTTPPRAFPLPAFFVSKKPLAAGAFTPRPGVKSVARLARVERAAFRLGAQDVTSYTVIARDFQCCKTLENTGFFSDWPVIR